MPLYPYRCEACGHVFEILQAMSEKPLRKCPECRRMKLEKLIGVPNVICRGIEHCKTVGQAAEENTKRLVQEHGREAAETIINEKVYGRNGRKLKLPKKAERVERPAEIEVPWWRSGHVEGTGPLSETPVSPAEIKDAAKYIRTGEKS